MYYEIEPLDNFFFRTSVPFEAGGETVAVESVFPPLPSVYAGAFRSLLFQLSSGGDKKIRIGFNGISLNQECLFPMPADLYWSAGGKGGGDGRLRPMELISRPLSNYPLDYCLCRTGESDGKDKERRNPHLRERAMAAYLNARQTEYDCLDLNAGYLVREQKVGIGIDPVSGTSKEHRLYQITTVRPAGDKLLKLIAEVEVRDAGRPETPLDIGPVRAAVRLGGEGKLASVRSSAYTGLKLDVDTPDTMYFKLYLATPAVFEKGWIPGWLDSNSREGTFTHKGRQLKVKLLGAAVGRGLPCGGFGYDKKNDCAHPRELRYAAPAGSVYYFKLLEGSFQDAVRLFHGKCISDYRESLGFDHPAYNKYRYCDRGFGYALVGKMNREQEERLNGR